MSKKLAWMMPAGIDHDAARKKLTGAGRPATEVAETKSPTKPPAPARTEKVLPPLPREPARFAAPAVEASPYENSGKAELAISQYKTSEDAKRIAVRLGASLDTGAIDDTTVEALLKVLKVKSGVSLAKLRADMALARRHETEEWLRWKALKDARDAARQNIVSGFDFLPQGFVAEKDTRRFCKRVTLGKEEKLDPICGVFNVLGITRNHESSAWGLVIDFTDKAGKRKEITCLSSEIQGDKRALCSRLGDEGLSIYCGPDDFGRFLLFVMDNVDQEIVTFERTGWHYENDGDEDEGENKPKPPRFFVTPTGEIIGKGDDENIEYRLKKGVGFTREKPPGEFDVWKRTTADMAEANELTPPLQTRLPLKLGWTGKLEGNMPRKRYTPEEIVAKLRQVEVLTAQGASIADGAKSIGITEQSYYRWRKEYGGLKTDQVKRIKELEAENQRLRKAVSDLTIDKLILKEAASGNY